MCGRVAPRCKSVSSTAYRPQICGAGTTLCRSTPQNPLIPAHLQLQAAAAIPNSIPSRLSHNLLTTHDPTPFPSSAPLPPPLSSSIPCLHVIPFHSCQEGIWRAGRTGAMALATKSCLVSPITLAAEKRKTKPNSASSSSCSTSYSKLGLTSFHLRYSDFVGVRVAGSSKKNYGASSSASSGSSMKWWASATKEPRQYEVSCSPKAKAVLSFVTISLQFTCLLLFWRL